MQPDTAGDDQVRKARSSDVERLAQGLARAFDDDPLTSWMFPDAIARNKRLPRLFVALLNVAMPLDEVYTTESLRASAIWNPPGTFPLGWRVNARMGFTMARLLRTRLAVCAPGLTYFDSHHPKEPHWYLQMLGTETQFQGKGLASALLSPVLERCDRTGERVYLEASKEQNIAFYARHGFAVTEEMQVPRGPKVWAMWREPR
jgi:ribosomal protein S18 acetylase RimI-like enzyme